MQLTGHEYTLKSIRTGPGMENDTLRATILRDGKAIGTVEDWGTGGGYVFSGIPDAVLADFSAYGKVEWAEYCDANGIEHSDIKDEKLFGRFPHADSAVDAIVNEALDARDLAKLLRKATRQTVFVLDGDQPPFSYRSFPARIAASRALEELRKPKYAAKHPRVLNGTNGEWEAVA